MRSENLCTQSENCIVRTEKLYIINEKLDVISEKLDVNSEKTGFYAILNDFVEMKMFWWLGFLLVVLG